LITTAGYCPRCAAALSKRPPTVCAACGYENYLNARPTGGVVLIEDGRFLVLRRAAAPKAGQWELPGGFCDGWEHPADAARREAREELGVDVELGPFLGMYLGGYEFQGETLPVLDCFWVARLGDAPIIINRDEALEYDWLPLDSPPRLAFSTMDAAVRAATIAPWSGFGQRERRA
jgi:ADP-ribose pyrophosphatase YjhB (NUDIX family)